MWGKGLENMSYKLQQHYDWYGDPGRVAVICAGNDVQHGVECCERAVEEVSKWNPTIFDAIPFLHIDHRMFTPQMKMSRKKLAHSHLMTMTVTCVRFHWKSKKDGYHYL